MNVQIKTTYKNGEVMEEKKFAIEKADPADKKKKKAKGKGGKKAKKPNLGQKRKWHFTDFIKLYLLLRNKKFNYCLVFYLMSKECLQPDKRRSCCQNSVVKIESLLPDNGGPAARHLSLSCLTCLALQSTRTFRTLQKIWIYSSD